MAARESGIPSGRRQAMIAGKYGGVFCNLGWDRVHVYYSLPA